MAGGKKCGACRLIGVLIIIGGLNWGLTGLGMLIGSDLNLVHLIFGSWAWLEALIYLVVGIATLVKIFNKCGCTHGCACGNGKCDGTCGAGEMKK